MKRKDNKKKRNKETYKITKPKRLTMRMDIDVLELVKSGGDFLFLVGSGEMQPVHQELHTCPPSPPHPSYVIPAPSDSSSPSCSTMAVLAQFLKF